MEIPLRLTGPVAQKGNFSGPILIAHFLNILKWLKYFGLF